MATESSALHAVRLVGEDAVTIRGSPLHWKDLLRVPGDLEGLARSSGIPVGAGNRIDLYRRVIRRHFVPEQDGVRMPTEEAARALLCAGSELRTLRFILTQLGRKRSWRDELGAVFGGAEHLHDDRNHDSRSRQAELHIAARLAWMGLGVEPGEPDIVARWGQWRFGVAVKRIRSEGQYRKRLEEGFDQIRLAKLPGLVAIDLTHLLWFDRKPLFVNHPDGMSIATLKMLQEFVFDHHARPLPMQRGGLPFGAIFFASTAARAVPNGHAQFCTGHLFVALCEESDPRKQRVLDLNRLLHRRSRQAGDAVAPVAMI